MDTLIANEKLKRVHNAATLSYRLTFTAMSTEGGKRTRVAKQKKTESVRMRFTPADKELLTRVTEAMEEPSDTQTVTRLIREKAKALGVSVDN